MHNKFHYIFTDDASGRVHYLGFCGELVEAFWWDEYVDLSNEEVRQAFVNALRPTWRERIRRRLRAIWKRLWA